MNKVNWTYMHNAYKTSFKNLFMEGKYNEALQFMYSIRYFDNSPSPPFYDPEDEFHRLQPNEIDYSGMRSVIALLESYKEHESGFFDPENPITPQECFPEWFN